MVGWLAGQMWFDSCKSLGNAPQPANTLHWLLLVLLFLLSVESFSAAGPVNPSHQATSERQQRSCLAITPGFTLTTRHLGLTQRAFVGHTEEEKTRAVMLVSEKPNSPHAWPRLKRKLYRRRILHNTVLQSDPFNSSEKKQQKHRQNNYRNKCLIFSNSASNLSELLCVTDQDRSRTIKSKCLICSLMYCKSISKKRRDKAALSMSEVIRIS